MLDVKHDKVTWISIHALLAESDLSCNANVNFTTCISIHALLAESDFATT